MKIRNIKFVMSNTDFRKCPKPELPEYAFIGRSNVGKSSLINAIAHTRIAKTSSKPGKTQLINHFLVNEDWYLVDLPGYGYAKVSQKLRADFQDIIRQYLLYRQNLMCVFVLIDIRHDLQQVDAEFLEWLGERQIPFCLVFTKSDKLKKGEAEYNLENIKEELFKTWAELPAMYITSAEKKEGLTDILDYIEEVNSLFEKPQL